MNANTIEETTKAKASVKLKLVRLSSTNEWIVKVFINGIYSEAATYFTDDYRDASDTRLSMAADYRRNGYEVEVAK